LPTPPFTAANSSIVTRGPSQPGPGWDPELLRLELGELKLGGFDLALTGFDEFEMAELLTERTGGLTDPDDAPEAPEHPVSVPGDLWILGRHRLLCGDSTVATDVGHVLSGVAPHLMVPDPPYGVEYDPAPTLPVQPRLRARARDLAVDRPFERLGLAAMRARHLRPSHRSPGSDTGSYAARNLGAGRWPRAAPSRPARGPAPGLPY
jgi:hypothetical protein